MITRPPIVVVLGHVDHGKTTLLDLIRQTNVVAGEAGAITQHIGAYKIELRTKDSKLNTITFIDTPGHEAFEQMRSRGANVADLAILVVAANDGVMPQTIEAIRHIKQAKIPMIVAINKIDLPNINLEKVKKQLVKQGVKLEGYGGDVVVMSISAKTGQGIPDLLEMVILLSEMEHLKAEPQGVLEAVVIEAKLDPRTGPLASVIVKKGTLRQGNEVFVENIKGKVRAMINDRGENLKEAGPGTPVEVMGFPSVPPVGSIITRKETTVSLVSTPSLSEPAPERKETKLKIILKTDVLGTLEAIIAGLATLPIEILSSTTGDITEGDVLLAKSTGAIIIGFNVKVASGVGKLAETENVKIKTYQIIYKLFEEIQEVIGVLIHPVEEEPLGRAEILAEFPYNKGKIAGCKIIAGRLSVGDKVKILRKDEEVGRAKIKSLKQQKEAVNKMEMGGECGVLFDNPLLDFAIGDVVLSLR